MAGLAPMLLDAPWPPDLAPSRVPFLARTVTVLRRAGVWDEMERLDGLTAADVAGWWNVGVRVLDDLIDTGNAAIAWHRGEQRVLLEVAAEPWTHQVWRRDGRFADLLPAVDATMAEVCLIGHHDHQRALWPNVDALRDRLEVLAEDDDATALRRYLTAVTDRHGDRLDVILRVMGLAEPEMTGLEGAAVLGISSARMSQLQQQMRRRVQAAVPPAGVWMPQRLAAAAVCRLTGR